MIKNSNDWVKEQIRQLKIEIEKLLRMQHRETKDENKKDELRDMKGRLKRSYMDLIKRKDWRER